MAINKITINIGICDQCLNPIPNGNKTHRAFDSTLCSQDCYIKLYNLIKKHDPQFLHPKAWKCSSDLEKLEKYTPISLSRVKPQPLKKIESMQKICIQTNSNNSPISIRTNNLSKIDLSITDFSMNKCIEVLNNIPFNILPYIQSGTTYVQEKVNTILGY